jgi:excisionase family DNA binding protein
MDWDVEELLTVAEIARLLRVSKMTVYRLVQSGELSALRVGGQFRVPVVAVKAYVTSRPARTGHGTTFPRAVNRS